LFVYCKLRVGCFVARILTNEDITSQHKLKLLDNFIIPNLPPVNHKYHRISENNTPTVSNFIHWAIAKRRYNVDYLCGLVNLVRTLEIATSKIKRPRLAPPDPLYDHSIYRTSDGPGARLNLDDIEKN
jgi:hypothetical protein